MRTREDILLDIEYSTKRAEYYTELAENYTKMAEEAKKELKEFDEQKGYRRKQIRRHKPNIVISHNKLQTSKEKELMNRLGFPSQ